MKKNDTIIVTGANGLAGSAVMEHLRKHMFTAVVGLTRDTVDLRSHDHVCEVFARIKPDYVFHAAATVYGIAGNMKNQGKSFFDNTLINTAVIDAAYRFGAKKIVAMGTNAIYPWPPHLPYREETIFDGRPHAAESAYGHAKRGMLAMLEAYHVSYGLDYAYLVSGNLFGPRDRFDPIDGHVLPSLIHKFYEASKSGGYVEVWGDGSARRDFLYSADLAEIVRLTLPSSVHSGAINIGSGQTHSIFEIAEMLCVFSRVPFDHVRYNPDMPIGRPICTSNLDRLAALGFEPEHTIGEGLRATWDWYKAHREATDVAGG
jgi:GDP-L-fucose synthase